MESFKNKLQAESYMHHRIEQVFPEVSKAIRRRRAEFYLLTHSFEYVEKLYHHGQIEDKDRAALVGEIDDKIFFLKKNPQWNLKIRTICTYANRLQNDNSS